MVRSFGSVVGWILAVVLTMSSLERSEAQFWANTPDEPFIVVEGVNSTDVDLVWKHNVRDSDIVSVTIRRRRQGASTDSTLIATGFGLGTRNPKALDLSDENLRSEYGAFEDRSLGTYTLRLRNVNYDEEYVYTITVLYQGGASDSDDDSVFVDVKVPPTITTAPAISVRQRIGSSVNLTCEASGDPMPNITWTREVATPNRPVNATGPVFPFVNIQLNDAGSYRCTADNGYGVVSSLSALNIFCDSECNTTEIAIRITRGAVWNSSLTESNSRSPYYKWLASTLTAEVSVSYSQPRNAGKHPYLIEVTRFSRGSVRAYLDLQFEKTVVDPLSPLRDAVATGTLGAFTVDTILEVNPTTGPPSSTTDPTKNTQKEPSVGARSGLSPEAMWGIIGACIAIVVVVVVIIVVCCICGRGRCCACRKGSGASKGKYTEADGYRMNKQPPSSGLGTASPAYVEARMYAPPNATKKQDDQPPPLNYSELSFEKSDKQPPPRYNPEYADVSAEKRPPPSGGQQGEGGFELWC
ncbi:uncharacterized protein [Montipora foliosa]|uniref:uncharacterized protein n=1 Tax=Montipora foliosa TaxID=591990 RepID=UPI0035F1F51C